MRTEPRFQCFAMRILTPNRDPFDNGLQALLTKIPKPAYKSRRKRASLVDRTGENDTTSTLSQLAKARYAPESMDAPAKARPASESLTVLSTLAEARAAVNEIAATAQRLISIYTPDLEPDLYDQTHVPRGHQAFRARAQLREGSRPARGADPGHARQQPLRRDGPAPLQLHRHPLRRRPGAAACLRLSDRR